MPVSDISLIPDNPGSPPGRTRIMNSLVRLLDTREFNRITTAQIAREAEVTEGLIYKYFKDKKDLLYQVLMELFRQVIDRIESETAVAVGAREKLATFIRASVASYAGSRVFSRIILLEVRNSKSFFASEAYALVRRYSGMLARILQEGVDAGEFAADIEIKSLREIIFGAIEHACLSCIIFDREIEIERVTGQLCRVIFGGILAQTSGQQERRS